MPELRSAARRRRRRRYRTGKALLTAGRSLVFVAILVAALTLLRAASRHDAPPPSATAGLPPLAARPYNPAVAPSSTAAPAPPPTDLIASVGPGGAGAATIDVPVGDGDRVIQVVVASPSLRPESNGAPTIESPTSVYRGGGQSVAVPGVTISDPDGVPQGEFGLLLYAAGTITLGDAAGMRLLVPNDTAWVAAVGTIEALNAALADLRFASDRDRATLTVVVTDFGHGNLDESLKATARIAIA